MHLYSEKDVWCRWRSVTLWQVELLFLLFHQWCYITGLRVSSPFWCEKHAHAVAVLNFIHACIHTWMDLHLFWPKAYFHIIRKAGRSVVSQRGLHLFLIFKKKYMSFAPSYCEHSVLSFNTGDVFFFCFLFPPLLSQQRPHTSLIAAACGDTVTWTNNSLRPTG